MTIKKSNIVVMPTPKYVRIPLTQNYNEHCLPFVRKGDYVKKGQPIAYASGDVGAPIHASVSGKVVTIEEEAKDVYLDRTVIVIEATENQEIWEGVKVPKLDNVEQLKDIINACGIVGLEGACIATHAKLDKKTLLGNHTLVVNGAEWAKYGSYENSLLIDECENIIEGITLLVKFFELKECFIGVDATYLGAIEALKKSIKTRKIDYIKITALDIDCPPGSDRVLIYQTTEDILNENNIPEDFGIMVANALSIAALGEYCMTGMPLVAKTIHLKGVDIKEPCLIKVAIGSTISQILKFAGKSDNCMAELVLTEGAIAERHANGEEISIRKDNNAIIIANSVESLVADPCKECDRCNRVCPMDANPRDIYESYVKKDILSLIKSSILKCTECGRCAYVCPTDKPLSYVVNQAKAIVLEEKNKAKN